MRNRKKYSLDNSNVREKLDQNFKNAKHLVLFRKYCVKLNMVTKTLKSTTKNIKAGTTEE